MEHADGRLLQVPDGQVFATSLPETLNILQDSNCIEEDLACAKGDIKASQVYQRDQLEVTQFKQPLTKKKVPIQPTDLSSLDNEQKGHIGQSSPEANHFLFQNPKETVKTTDSASELDDDSDKAIEKRMPRAISPPNNKQSELTESPGIQSSAMGLQLLSREDNNFSANSEPRQSIDNNDIGDTVQRTVITESIDEESRTRKIESRTRKIEKTPGAQLQARQKKIKAIQSSTSKIQSSSNAFRVQKSRCLDLKHQKLQNIKEKLIEGLSANEVVLQTHLKQLNVIEEKVRQARAFRDSTKERLLIIHDRLENRLESRLPDTEEQKIASKADLINVDSDVAGSSQAVKEKENLPAERKLYTNKDKVSSKTADLYGTHIEVKKHLQNSLLPYI